MEEPETFIRKELTEKFVVKPKSIGRPTQYLGNKVSYLQLIMGTMPWASVLHNMFKMLLKMWNNIWLKKVNHCPQE